MARYEHLPIYKKAMEINVYLQNTVRNFSRYNKYTIGADMRETARSILSLIIRANSTIDKESIIRELVERCEMLKTLLVFAKEARALESFKAFQHASGLAVILCKQSQGWLKSSNKSPNHRPSVRMDK